MTKRINEMVLILQKVFMKVDNKLSMLLRPDNFH